MDTGPAIGLNCCVVHSSNEPCAVDAEIKSGPVALSCQAVPMGFSSIGYAQWRFQYFDDSIKIHAVFYMDFELAPWIDCISNPT
jgi:hypothetical protein